jgi:hypothetical protein
MADGAREDLPTFYGRLSRAYVDVPPYQRLWQACVSGTLPAARIDSRWKVLEGAETAAVAAFDLKPRQQQNAA